MNKINIYWILLVTACLALLPASGKAETMEQAFVQAYQTNPVLAAERAKLRGVDEQVSQAQARRATHTGYTGNRCRKYLLYVVQVHGAGPVQTSPAGGADRPFH